jgi:pyruvate,orthophosphate dikinase
MATASQQSEAHALSDKLVYLFGEGRSEASGEMRNLLGGKGAGLGEMSSLGIPVPPGFTITTEVCNAFYALGRRYPAALEAQVREGVAHIERVVGEQFGDPKNPLLVSYARARVSMPGMMDTVLLRTQRRDGQGLARRSTTAVRVRLLPALRGDVRRCVPDAARQGDGRTRSSAGSRSGPRGAPRHRASAGVAPRSQYKGDDPRPAGGGVPGRPGSSSGARSVVFGSWQNPRAVVTAALPYPADWARPSTCRRWSSGPGRRLRHGRGFMGTRHGAPGLTSEYLLNAGRTWSRGFHAAARRSMSAQNGAGPSPSDLPDAYVRCRYVPAPRAALGDMQDIEFTVQQSGSGSSRLATASARARRW